MAFPPAKEYLYVPSELINKSNLLCCQVMTTRGNPVFDVVDRVSHDFNGLLGLIHSGGTQQHNGVVEYVAVRIDFIGFQYRFLGSGFDAADKMLSLFLPLIKSIMGLVSTVGNASLPRRKDHADKRALSAIAVGKEHLSWNAMV